MARVMKKRAAQVMREGDRVVVRRVDGAFNAYEGRRLRVVSVDGPLVKMLDEAALQSVLYDTSCGAQRGYHATVERDD